ncbi:hypothetical protein TWF106_010436 [Orbilia oligospora]|uniref:Glycoside hydrolase 131 catalytic N-terminal domain-containing protein n=1 Tax=Orbilia oligospora TaxID=2813651 RepID=A0A6G1M8K9_ORBOL|nr:hypothetical protein TWF788_006549 [Orbilia oligospora]KAF3207692.1 hypothetical protein TWF679_008259 [Orbilia oligospora]KAF3210777.1 hypothetical protein TWF106_010436 [Orbilia oligospora]KAF3213555.1 hypothetical protein TWF191_010029 [Orbilia oligospora]KAF3249459.1 hypothetical protein TWF192_005534 [Orbilia oligospora]
MMPIISAVIFAAVAQAVPTTKTTTAIGVNPIVFDGRIPPLFRAAKFDSYATSPYNAEYVLGQEPWSKVIQFPNIPDSLFDVPLNGKSLIVKINNKSIFAPGGPQNAQTGFRRSELLPGVNSGNDATNNGVTAHHFSIRTDPTRPLNYTHEYQPVFIETQDYSSHVWQLKTGTPFAESWPLADAKTLRLYSSSTSSAPSELLNVPFTEDEWHNFAIESDWDNNLITVYYSTGLSPLAKVVGPVSNDASGKGQFHIGLLKLPTGPAGINVVKEGYQSKRPNEGLTYGGIFIEDTSAGSVTLEPISA